VAVLLHRLLTVQHSPNEGRLRLSDDEALGLKSEGCEVIRYVAVLFPFVIPERSWSAFS